MRIIAVLALAVILLPAVIAVAEKTHDVTMQSTLVAQGYSFARVQGFNSEPTSVNILHWHTDAELGLSHAFCEMQPATLPPGLFDVEIAVQCQTRSGFTTLFPKGTKVKTGTFVEGTPNFRVETLTIETGARVPTPFPIATVGHAIREEASSGSGSLLFIAGMGAIAILAAAVILFSLKHNEE